MDCTAEHQHAGSRLARVLRATWASTVNPVPQDTATAQPMGDPLPPVFPVTVTTTPRFVTQRLVGECLVAVMVLLIVLEFSLCLFSHHGN